jgi:hypothetical protein
LVSLVITVIRLLCIDVLSIAFETLRALSIDSHCSLRVKRRFDQTKSFLLHAVFASLLNKVSGLLFAQAVHSAPRLCFFALSLHPREAFVSFLVGSLPFLSPALRAPALS